MTRDPAELRRKIEALLVAEGATLQETIIACGSQMVIAARDGKIPPAKLAAIVLTTYAEHHN